MGGEAGEGFCSSKNSFKKPWSWTVANFETDRRPCFGRHDQSNVAVLVLLLPNSRDLRLIDLQQFGIGNQGRLSPLDTLRINAIPMSTPSDVKPLPRQT